MRLRQTVGGSASGGMDAPFGRETLAGACGQRQRRGEPAFRSEDRRRDVGVRRPLHRLAGDRHRHPADGAVLAAGGLEAAAGPREIAMAIYGAKRIAAESERDGWMCSRVRRRIERSTGLMEGGFRELVVYPYIPVSYNYYGRQTIRPCCTRVCHWPCRALRSGLIGTIAGHQIASNASRDSRGGVLNGIAGVIRRRRLTPWNRRESTCYHADRRPICTLNNNTPMALN